MLGLMILMLISLNLGGIFSVIMQISKGEWLGAITSLLGTLLLDAFGFWLLRDLRSKS